MKSYGDDNVGVSKEDVERNRKELNTHTVWIAVIGVLTFVNTLSLAYLALTA